MKFVSNNDCEGQREKQEGIDRAHYQKVKGFHVVKVTMKIRLAWNSEIYHLCLRRRE